MKCTCEECSLSHAFYHALKPESVESYCTAKKELNFPPGTRVIKQGEPIKEFIYLQSGLVKLERKNPTTGVNQIISFNRPKDFITLMDIFGETHFSYSITTLEESTFCIFNLKDVKALLNEDALFGKNLIDIISHETNKVINNLLIVIEKRLYGKVAYLLLYFADTIFNAYEYDLPVSRKEMAEHLGLSIETVIRTLSEFRKDKLIKVYGKRIEILDKTGLQKVMDNN
jgi:CRP/FNR family transcriptional regulator